MIGSDDEFFNYEREMATNEDNLFIPSPEYERIDTPTAVDIYGIERVSPDCKGVKAEYFSAHNGLNEDSTF